MPKKPLTRKEAQELVDWAKRALHGLDDSHVFVGVLNDHVMGPERIEFLLQLGHCIMTGKPIIIPAPFNVEVPAKLRVIADRIVRYEPGDMESLQNNLAAVLVEMGIIPQ